MAEVALEQVGKTYPNGVQALRDVSLQVAAGELVVLVGPSGGGKTTTLRLIAGLETPTRGLIRIGGRVVNGQPPHRRDVAMVFQRPALYPHLNVAANLAFGLTVREGWGRRLRRWLRGGGDGCKRVEEVARLLELSALLDRRPAELSGGQQQRVALGRALVRQPAVFLLDEPLSDLEPRLRLEMRRELHLLHCRIPATMILVTHDQEEALALGDRVVVLDQGVIQQADSPSVLYQRPANRSVAAMIGWPPMYFLDGRLVEEEDRLVFVGAAGRLAVPSCREAAWRPLAGRKVVVGVRPEHVRLGDGDQGAMRMEVRLVERLGAAHLVTLCHGDWTVTTRRDGGPAPTEGTVIGVKIALAHAHLFDPATGRALAHGQADG